MQTTKTPSYLGLQQRLVQWLTCSGTFPVIALALTMIFYREVPEWMMQALLSYSAIILGFLGGIHWGIGLSAQRASRFILAVLPALYAWGAFLLPWPWSAWVLALGFVLMLGVDWLDRFHSLEYRKLRLAASSVVVLHLIAAALFVSPASATLASVQPLPQALVEKVTMKNVLGTELQLCSSNPRTGFYRNGYCETGPDDRGTHTVCAVVTEEFLEYTLSQGNDLITPRPDYNFLGLNPGDRWCLCALRWQESLLAGVAPPVVLEASEAKSLDYVNRDELMRHAWPQFTGAK